MKLLVSALLLASLVACRPKPAGKDSSNAESLDNLAKPEAAQTVNHCGSPYDGKAALEADLTAAAARIDAPSEELKNEAIGTLMAAPPALRAPFLLAQGRIVIGVGATEQCKDTPFSAAEQALSGSSAPTTACWKANKAGDAPVIYLGATTTDVRRGLLRLVGYTYTEFFVARIMAPGAPAPFNGAAWQTAAQNFVATRDALAAAFLADSASGDPALSGRLNNFQVADAGKFGNFVFAEALDSYYCSAETRKTFGSSFQGTYRLFTDAKNPNSPVSQFGAR